MHRFLLGFFMSAINPVQIPFWFGWSAILFEKKLLEPNPQQYFWYILGIGLGTLIGNCVFIYGGPLAAQAIGNNQKLIALIIGGIFAMTAILQIIMLIKKKRNAQAKN
jgi:threonine/homoserine/homoserine lactone efflux protein